MKKHWKTIAMTLLSALGSAIMARLNRSDETPSQSAVIDSEPDVRSRVADKPTATGMRGMAVEFLSDVMAETYRKLRVDPRK
ncbi:MAG: hypothetical protein KAX40_04215 [Herpetosiphon sp.]|nr:hypothetical protein [Herpetosiphon sp.]